MILRVRGVDEPAAGAGAPDPGRFRSLVSVRQTEGIRMGDARGDSVREVEIAPDQVVELELEGGVRLWTSADRLQETLVQTGQRPRGGDELLVPPALQIGPASRGAGQWALRALRLLHVDVASLAARELVAKLEDGLDPGAGLYLCPTPAALGPRIDDGAGLRADAPILLFLHGTASSTAGSFGGLAEAERLPLWDRLARTYGDNMVAFEHRTLSQSPIQNALELVRLLPENAVLHVVSHSRGGLVGELLCRARVTGRGDEYGDLAPFDALDLARFRKDPAGLDRAADLAALQALHEELAARRPRVERFVRVACPARGTTLASGRLDLYLSIITNLIGLIPPLRATPVYEFVTALLLAVAKKRTDPKEIPGLEAQMPRSPLIAVLNQPGVTVDADLSVIAGDTQGAGVIGRLKALATDLFYRENHDVVVQTSAMTGGARRQGGARLHFAKGADVDHFHYFRNARTAEKLHLALTRADGADAGFEPITEATAEELKSRAPAVVVPGTRPVVFVVPGIMGSHLGPAGNRIWIDLWDLARGKFGGLAIDAPGIQPHALVGRAYDRIVRFLWASHEVVEFPFDWRRSILEEGARLGDAVAGKLGETSQPVRILAHSMGGLVSRAMIAQRPAVWQKLIERDGGRLVMLGTPNGGSWVIPRVLLGQEQVFRYLVLLDIDHGPAELLRLVARMPGVLEMLPVDRARDLYDVAGWRELSDAWSRDWSMPEAAALSAARELHALLGRPGSVDAEHMVYVAGRAPATPIGCRIDTSLKGAARIQFLATAQGDGRVPWSTGRLEGVKTWYMNATHGELANHRPAFGAILELLQRGTTAQLPDQPPAEARGVESVFVLPPDEAVIYPDHTELEAAALGLDTRVEVTEEVEPLEVSVVHGNLAFSPYPVAVGHYEEDTIAGAEKALDHHLAGRLSEKRRLGLYPGAVGTSGVFLRPDRRPRGAIIVGLGRVGSLTGATLERSFERAVLNYAARVAEGEGAAGNGAGPRAANITALLIGSGRGGIPVEDSVRAILQATLRARETLRTAGLAGRVRIDRLELCELYEDVAIVATRALHRIANEPRVRDRLRALPLLASRTGGRRRVAFEEAEDWWDRLQVHADVDGGLVFRSLTERARAEVQLMPNLRDHLDEFLGAVTAQSHDDPALAATLFELLVPNDLKDYAPDRNDIVLVLDTEAARYPWELLRDGSIAGGVPLAVNRGLIRQLDTVDYRRKVATPLGNDVLVVGDPVTTRFASLPGAEREARAVAEVLGANGYAVTPLIREEARAIVQALFARPYRIVHMAAHGVYQWVRPEDRERDEQDEHVRAFTGMVLGDNSFLEPAMVNQMRNVPELVFLNCCHLGRTEPERVMPQRGRRPELAANLAAQLIAMGVRAIVAAGWEVQDDAAATFARTFYDALLRGRAFGDAVLEARKETYERHPGYNTWGAYQCYGDQGYTLARGDERERVPETYTCAAEVIVALDNIAQDADTTAQHGLALLRARLAAIETLLQDQPRWLRHAGVRGALARASAQLDLFDTAAAHYQALLAGNRANYTVDALEQLANLRSRWAVHRWKRGDGAAPEALEELRAEVRAALRSLERLPRGDAMSAERRSLIGSAYKRLSQLSATPDERLDALGRMARAYHKAHDQALRERGRPDTYPLHNWLAAEVVLHHLGGNGKLAKIEELLAAGELATLEDEADDPTFWTGVARADARLIRELAGGDITDHAEAIIQAYRDAWQRGGAPRQLRSVTEHIEWLIDALTPSFAEGDVPDDVRARVEKCNALAAGLRTVLAGVHGLVEAEARSPA